MRYSTCQNSIFASGGSVMFVVFHSGPLDPSAHLTAHRIDTKIVTGNILRYSGTNTKSPIYRQRDHVQESKFVGDCVTKLIT